MSSPASIRVSSRRRAPWCGLGLFVCIATLLAACSGGGRGGPANLLLVSVDTLRPDRLGCYGDPRARTPHWDRLARRGEQFRTALAHAPFTLPSHASLLSGEYPFQHLVRSNAMRTFAPAGPTIGEVLRDEGRRTAAFTASAVLDTTGGLHEGFEVWEWRDREGQIERRAGRVVASAARWLDGLGADERFFLFVHFYDPHEPYTPTPYWAAVFPDDPYRGEVATTDRALGRVLMALEYRERLDETMVVALSDHGEEFGEHGATGHGFFVYETAIRVPLVVRGAPGFSNGRLREDVARMIDVAPTIVEAFSGPDRDWVGRPLQSVASREEEIESYSETWWAALELDASELRALHQGEWKYIFAPREELYDLALDPGERENLISSEPNRVERFRRRLAELLGSDLESPGGFDAAPTLDADRIAQLEALGYLGGSSLDAGRDREALPDPKDLATFPENLRQIELLITQKKWAEVLPLADEVLEFSPAHTVALSAKANALFGLDRIEEGFAAYDRALERHSDLPGVWNDYGFALLTHGEFERARRAFRKAIKLQDGYLDARFNLAVAAIKSNRQRVAWAELKEILKRKPDHAQARAMAKDLEAAGAPPLLEE